MELSQSRQRDLQILLNCKGKYYCQKNNCPVYDIYNQECGYKNVLLVLSTQMYNAFEPDDKKPPQGELVVNADR